MKYLKKFFEIYEDEGFSSAPAGGTAMVNQGTITGLGNVISAQPSQLPGQSGTTGSGDYGMSLYGDYKRNTKNLALKTAAYSGNMTSAKKSKKFKLDKVSQLKDFLKKYQKDNLISNKILSYDDFLKDAIVNPIS